MNTVAKILIVVNLILAAAFLMSASNFLGQQDLWKAKHKLDTQEIQDELDLKVTELKAEREKNLRLNEQSRALQAQAAANEAEAREARLQADLLKEQFNQASLQLTQATAALEKAQDTIKSNRAMIDTLNSERAALAESKRAALDAKEAAVRSLAEKELQFENLLAQKQALEARVEDLGNQLRSAQLTAETAVSKAGGAGDVPMDQPHHQGQILSVDNKANVAVISLGAEDGVRPGFRYTISRGSNYVGMLEITDVQAKQSAGRAIKSLQKGDMMRGDRVMSR